MKSKLIIFKGEVQGVGFRFTTFNIAKKYKICGWVKNLSDGTVELQAQGEEDEINNFLTAIHKSRLGDLIQDRTTNDNQLLENLNNFDIKY